MMPRTNKFYRKNEREVMEWLGFRPTKNSGSGWVEKEDGINDTCICQLKSTDAKSISIKQEDLHVLEYNSAVAHKIPIFAVQFLNTDELWLMIKPEDIKNVKGILSGEVKEKEIVKNVDLSIDTEHKKGYNVKEDKERTLAREKFYKKRKEDIEKKEKEWRDRETEWRKNLRKKV